MNNKLLLFGLIVNEQFLKAFVKNFNKNIESGSTSEIEAVINGKQVVISILPKAGIDKSEAKVVSFENNGEVFNVYLVYGEKEQNEIYIFNQMLATFKFINSQDEITNWEVYNNDEYGFEITLLGSWEGYSILTESWNGTTLDEKATQHQGPKIIIRNPKWSVSQAWQDIPIMVFTKQEWKLIEAKNLNVSAAPVGPSKLGENQKYVFALPPRWVGYDDSLGQDEAQEIAKTIKIIIGNF